MILSLGFMICPPPGLTSTEKKREYRINYYFKLTSVRVFIQKKDAPILYQESTFPELLEEVHYEKYQQGNILQWFSHCTQIFFSFICSFFNFKYSRTHCDIKIYTADQPRVICMDFIPWNIFQLLLNITVLCMP